MLTAFAPRPVAAKAALLGLQKQVHTADAVIANAGGTSESQFVSSQVVIPANSLQVGQSITIRAHLTFTQSTAGPSQRPRVRLGSVLLIDAGDLGLLANVPNARAYVEATMNVRAIGINGKVEAAGMLTFTTMGNGQAMGFLAGPSGTGSEAGNPVTLDTTVTQTLAMSTQYSAATAGNQTVLRQCRVYSDFPVG